MERYIGTKIILAKPMTRGKYNRYRGWEIPDNENPNDEGYLVEYPNSPNSNHNNHENYISWSPKDVFDEAYQKTVGLTFSQALEALKAGQKITRHGWNGNGMFVVYQKGYPEGIPCNQQTAEAWGMKEGDLFQCDPYLQIRTVRGTHSMWVPSINDVLAEDWEIL